MYSLVEFLASDPRRAIALWVLFIVFFLGFIAMSKHRGPDGTLGGFLLSLFRGEHSLAVTFWGWFIAPLCLALFGLFIWFVGTAWVGYGEVRLSQWISHYVGLVSIILIPITLIGSGYLVIRSALNKKPVKLIDWLACIAVIAIAVQAFIPHRYSYINFINNNGAPAREEKTTGIQGWVNRYNRDPHVQMLSSDFAIPEGATFSYRRLTLQFNVKPEWKESFNAEHERRNSSIKLCLKWHQDFLKEYLSRIDLRFRVKDQFETISMTKDYCFNFIKMNNQLNPKTPLNLQNGS